MIVADSRGHGRSTRNEQPYGYDLMASDYLALLDYLKIDKAALVGWSDGGIIGIDIAMNHPERLTPAVRAGRQRDGRRRRSRRSWTTRRSTPTSSAPASDYKRCRRRPTSTTPSSSRSGRCGKASRTGASEQLAKITVADRDRRSATMTRRIKREHTDYMAAVDTRREAGSSCRTPATSPCCRIRPATRPQSATS